jgi:tetratricopeptide (TPR) repeat protein
VGTLEANESAPKPEVVSNVDMRTLPIGPEEAYVLSRVDGTSSEAEIILATGLDGERVRHALERLEHLGAIRFSPTPPRPANSSPAPERVSQPVASTPTVRRLRSHSIDPAALAEPVDLDPERKQAVLELFSELDELSHYELLEVAADADKKVIKEAYYRAVALFHPDKYFGKNLGSYKVRLEQIFRRLTEAHDVLTKSQTRHEYDEYLVTRNRNRAFEQAWSALDVSGASAEVSVPEATIQTGRGSWEPDVPRPSPPPSSAPPSSAGMALDRPSDPEIRRRALARKLTGSSQPPTSGVSTPPPDAAAMHEKAADDLRRHRAERLAQAQQAQVRRYLAAAEAALAAGSAVSAATALRIASSLAPDDPELSEQLRKAEARAASDQADSYLAQAEYEERHGKFAEAARAYERASLGKPSPRVSERIAYCLLESNGDARKALENARRAVAAAADHADYRVTLGRAYLLAGMRQSALGELERAQQLAPGDDKIKDWIRRIKRHEV